MVNNHYLIVGYARSGTTVIHLLLKGHPNIAALNDELKVSPLFTQGISTFTFGNNTAEEYELSFSILFDAISSITANKTTKISGAKLALSSLNHTHSLVNALQQYLKDLKIIITVRNDLVAQYGSLISAQKYGIWHSWYKNFENRQINKVTINKNLFIEYVINCLDTYVILRELYKTHTVLESIYEDFLINPIDVKQQLFDFLKVPQVDVTWLESKKVMPEPSKYITNYAEMTNLLKLLRAKHECGELDRLRTKYAHGNFSIVKKIMAKISQANRRF